MPTPELVIASANPDKVAEIGIVLEKLAVLIPRPEGMPDVVEDGDDIILAERHHISAGHVNSGEAWIPNNHDIVYTMTTKDNGEHPAVLHAPFLNEWGVKEDVTPGIWTTMYFHPQDTGSFELTCTEYCGLQHSLMIATVHVVEPLNGGAV